MDDGFDCFGAAMQLKKQLVTLTHLNYDNMEVGLFAKNVITLNERMLIKNQKIGREKMEYLIVEIIIPSLQAGISQKYKLLLEVMEESEDLDLQSTAKMLRELSDSTMDKGNKPDDDKFREYLEHAKRNNETEELCLYKLVIFGPPRVGKSSLFQVLLGKIPKKVSESTGVCNRLMFKVAITKDATGSKSKWYEIKLEDEISRLQAVLQEKRSLSNSAESLSNTRTSEPVRPLLDVEKKMVENVKNESPNQSCIDIKYTTTLMVCYDSGGQPEFFDVMPSLATNPGGYIMVFDMSKDLSKPIESKVLRKQNEISLPTKTTSVDLLKNAIASIQSCSGNSLRHHLLVVGTHLDKCDNPEEQVPRLDQQIYTDLVKRNAESLFRRRRENNNENKRNLDCTQIIHPIANLMECFHSTSQERLTESKDRDNIAQEIRTAVEEMSKNDSVRKELPINWLLFQLETQLKLAKSNYISRKTCSEYAKSCYIEENEIDDVLSYFHGLGIILYFKQVVDVVFSPQWLFDRLSEIVFEKYNKYCRYDVVDDIKKGRIQEDTLIELYKKNIDVNGPLKVPQLLEVFISQKIMARFPNNEMLLFMPSLLNPDPERLVNKNLCSLNSDALLTGYGGRKHGRLYVKFGNQYFPRSVFCSLATEFIKNKWLIQDDPQYNNILVFQVRHKDEYIGLFDCKTELAIELYKDDDKDLSIQPHEVCAILCDFLTAVCKSIRIVCNFEFGFTCETCKCFAGIKLTYPFLPKKHCRNCTKPVTLKFDELIWVVSPKEFTDILNAQPQESSVSPLYVDDKKCSEVIENITEHYDSLTRSFPVDSLMSKLVAKKVIDDGQKEEIQKKTLKKDKVSFLFDDVIKPELELDVSTKYDNLIKVLEDGDSTTRRIADLLEDKKQWRHHW